MGQGLEDRGLVTGGLGTDTQNNERTFFCENVLLAPSFKTQHLLTSKENLNSRL